MNLIEKSNATHTGNSSKMDCRKLRMTCSRRDGMAAILGLCLTKLTANSAETPKLVGLKAPDFVLAGTDGAKYRLSDLLRQGPVIVCWFPKAYTGNTEATLKSLVSVRDKLSEHSVSLLAASCDKKKYLAPFASELNLNYPILADPTRTTAIQWAVVGEGREIPHRWIYFIGRDGRIVSVLSEFQAVDAADAVMAKAQALGWTE